MEGGEHGRVGAWRVGSMGGWEQGWWEHGGWGAWEGGSMEGGEHGRVGAWGVRLGWEDGGGAGVGACVWGWVRSKCIRNVGLGWGGFTWRLECGDFICTMYSGNLRADYCLSNRCRYDGTKMVVLDMTLHAWVWCTILSIASFSCMHLWVQECASWNKG